jgi:hypothetical protein
LHFHGCHPINTTYTPTQQKKAVYHHRHKKSIFPPRLNAALPQPRLFLLLMKMFYSLMRMLLSLIEMFYSLEKMFYSLIKMFLSLLKNPQPISMVMAKYPTANENLKKNGKTGQAKTLQPRFFIKFL